MNFDLSDEQRMLIDTVRRFIADKLQPLEEGIEATGVLDDDTARTVHAQARALGLYALNMPTELGGAGLGAVDAMLCEQQFGHTTDILIRRAFGNVYEAPMRRASRRMPGQPPRAGCSTAASTSSATGCGPTFSWCRRARAKRKSRSSWSTRACPVSPSARTSP
jgi:acyl-CoA dehydrogenase